jgi:hypothetical protein
LTNNDAQNFLAGIVQVSPPKMLGAMLFFFDALDLQPACLDVSGRSSKLPLFSHRREYHCFHLLRHSFFFAYKSTARMKLRKMAAVCLLNIVETYVIKFPVEARVL